jgi:hypothetical protein
MRRIGIVGLSTAAFAFAAMLALPTAALAQICGDGHKDSGEQCDLGTGPGGNGQGCCNANCTNVATGANCIANVTGSDSCNQGICQSNNVCNTSGGLIDPCTLGSTCNTCVSTGSGRTDFTCTGSDAPAGTACTFDSDLCTVDTCNGSGTCGSAPKVCPQPSNTCQIGACRSSDGACITQNKSSGAVCNDGNPCTQGEVCSGAGANCNQGISFVANNTPCDDKNTCTTGEKCNGAGSCTGGTNVASGTGCEDGNSCTNNTCNGSGGCTISSFLANGATCGAFESCRTTGTCLTLGNPAFASICTGQTPINEGAACSNFDPCNNGICQAGTCLVRDQTQISGAVEDYNSCTDASDCNAAGFVINLSCVDSGTCEACGDTACGTNENQTSKGLRYPCLCTFSQ